MGGLQIPSDTQNIRKYVFISIHAVFSDSTVTSKKFRDNDRSGQQ